MAIEITEIPGLIDESDSINELFGGDSVSLHELFPPDFVDAYSEFESFDEFLTTAPWDIESNEDVWSIPADEFDRYIDLYTVFDSWQAMVQVGAREFLLRKLIEKESAESD